jgi:hypothetical protein
MRRDGGIAIGRVDEVDLIVLGHTACKGESRHTEDESGRKTAEKRHDILQMNDDGL